MDELSSKLAEYAEEFKNIVVDHAPEAYEALLRIVQVDAAQELTYGIMGIAFGGTILYLAHRFYKKYPMTPDQGAETPGPMMGVICLAIIGGLFVLFSSDKILDIWNWVAFIDPDLALANKILESSGLKP